LVTPDVRWSAAEVLAMSWRVTNVLEERMKFVTAWWTEDWTMTDLCTAFGISRKTGYKLLNRYATEGIDGLKDRSSAPKTHPNETEPELVALILKARKAHPRWGPRKLLPWLSRRHPSVRWPAASTIGDILRRHGEVQPRRKRRRVPPATRPFSRVEGPNDVWCADFKGWFRTLNGHRCEPLTVTDAHSRYLLTCQAVRKTDEEHVQPHFWAAFRTYGLPRVIRTDNGAPFASTGLCGLSKLSVWWLKLGIRPERIEPGKPQQNGRHERMHLTLKQETAIPPAATLTDQQIAFDRFKQEYNRERPHEALGNATPADEYSPSVRRYPRRLPEFVYPRHFEVRVVRNNGLIRWNGERIALAPVLAGEPVGLEQVTEQHWKIYLGEAEVGVLDEDRGKILRYTKLVITTEN
jgi:transposase InsO family protein